MRKRLSASCLDISYVDRLLCPAMFISLASSCQPTQTRAVLCQRPALSKHSVQTTGARHAAAHLSSCRPVHNVFTNRGKIRRRIQPRATTNVTDLPLVRLYSASSECTHFVPESFRRLRRCCTATLLLKNQCTFRYSLRMSSVKHLPATKVCTCM